MKFSSKHIACLWGSSCFNLLLHIYSSSHINKRLLLKTLWGKEEVARSEQFLLFPQCFLLGQIIVSPFVHISAIISLFAAELEQLKIGIRGKKLKADPTGCILMTVVQTCFENNTGDDFADIF